MLINVGGAATEEPTAAAAAGQTPGKTVAIAADADLPPVRFPNPCRLRRHPLPGELPASRPVAPVIVLPLWMVMILLGIVVFVDEASRSTSADVVILIVVV